MLLSRRFNPAFAVFGMLLLPLPVMAQADRGSIKGQVLDSKSGSVPNASLMLLNEATGVSFRSTSTSTGDYDFNI